MEAQNLYIGEAYRELLKMSADERKRLEYEAREKAIRDKNAMLHYAKRTGREEGEKIGQERGQEMKLLEQIKKKLEKKKSVSQIADELEDTEENILKIMEKYKLV